MGSLYLTDLSRILTAEGIVVVEYTDWQYRARSSGGYDAPPLCVMWHHTASGASAEDDAYYMCYAADTRPIANILLARDGVAWVLAAGATNTNGTGRSRSFSRGTVPADSMNTRAVGVEIANNGVGEFYPQAQIDAAFAVSNALNRAYGNQPTDCCTHQDYAPDRKIDPAMASTVYGWHPQSVTGAGTWSVQDLRAECTARSSGPTPTPNGETDMYLVEVMPSPSAPSPVVLRIGETVHHVTNGIAVDIDVVFGVRKGGISVDQCEALLVDRQAHGPSPFAGPWSNADLDAAWRNAQDNPG